MRGYPRNPSVLMKVDIMNLLNMSEYAEKIAKDLAKLAEVDDSKITIDEGTPEKSSVKQITNPLPSWKKAGFESKEEMLNIAKVKLKPVPTEDPIKKEG